jgi:hypothetical protein
MIPEKQSPEALAAPRALESDPSSSLVNSLNATKTVDHQYRLIATVPKSGREEFRIAIRHYNGDAKIELRIFQRDRGGEWNPTPRHVVINKGTVAELIAALREAEARLVREIAECAA